MAAPEQQSKARGIQFYGVDEVYSESGVDLTLLRENLRLSVEDRLQKGNRALEFALAPQQSGSSAKGPVLSFDWALDTRKPFALVKLLAAHRAQYVICGAQAMHAQGSTCMTEEIDICYQRTKANLEAVVAAFGPFHPSLRGAPPKYSFHLDVPTLAAGLDLLLLTDCGYLNLLGEVNGIG